MESLEQLDLKGKRVLVRVDFNVPRDAENNITDDSRLQAHIPTISAILQAGGSPVLMAHMGRPEGTSDPSLSLSVVVKTLEKLTGCKVKFSPDCVGEGTVNLTQSLKKNEIALLENLRFHEEEKKGDESFAEKLAQNGDVYVNDAFGAAHRQHASTAVIAQFFKGARCFGKVMEAEIENIQKVLNSPEKPVTAIVGGAKVSSKISVLENLLQSVDELIVGGGMTYTFIKAKGGRVGSSMVENDYLQTALNILKKADEQGVNVYLPKDSVVANSFSNEAGQRIASSDDIEEGWMGLDAGPQAIEALEPVIARSKVILWNGPLGVFEFENFAKGSRELARMIEQATEKGAFSLVGGGDSVAAIKKFGGSDKVSYVSTGGGAMLEFLEGKELPGIKAMKA